MKETLLSLDIPMEKKNEAVKVGKLTAFDPQYFRELEGERGWIAIGNKDYKNQRYFTVLGENGEKFGIVGMFDGDEEKNLTHIVIDPKYCGQNLAFESMRRMMDELGEDHFVSIVNLDNKESMRAHAKIPGIKITSDEVYEKEYHKRRFRYDKPQEK